MTGLFGVIGDPVSHSLSPVIHNAWMRDHGMDATYEAFQVPAGALEAGLATLERRGATGLNITLPHKEAALQLATSQSDIARRIGAANTLVRTQAGWHAENTDAPGFAESLRAAGIDVAGQAVCVLGAGGAARAVVLALSGLRADLTICNRTVRRAEDMVRHLGIEAKVRGLDSAQPEMARSGVVINTLSLGYTGQALDFPDGHSRTFYDISYGKAARAMLSAAAGAGWRTVDGLSMLVAQAAFSFEHWFGILPDMEGALARCRRLVEATT